MHHIFIVYIYMEEYPTFVYHFVSGIELRTKTMAWTAATNFNVPILPASTGLRVTYLTADSNLVARPTLKAIFSAGTTTGLRFRCRVLNGGRGRGLTPPSALMLPQNPVAADICAAALTGGTAFSLIQLWGEIANRGFIGQVRSVRFCLNFFVGIGPSLVWCRGK